jgi:hypothetical protein
MDNMLTTPDLPSLIKQLTLAEVEQRLFDLDAERAALSLLRRSIAARDRARRRRQCGKEASVAKRKGAGDAS